MRVTCINVCVAFACFTLMLTFEPCALGQQSAATKGTSESLSRDQLLQFSAADGTVRPVTSLEQWNQRRSAILSAMQSVMGKFPAELSSPRMPPAMRVIESERCDGYVRKLIEYESQPGSFTPAYLCIPERLLESDGQRTAAMLCLHPTDNTNGHKVVLGLGGRPNRQYAAELAARGYVTLSPSYPLLANYQPEIEALGWQSGTLKAVWDNLRGVDLLESLPYVQSGKIGAIGHSLGGHNSVYTAVFDQRIQVIVSSCGLDRYRDYYDANPEVWRPGRGWTQLRYMPRLAEFRGRLDEIPFDFPEMIAALAPRHVLIVAPLHDSNFGHQSVDKIAASAREVFRLHGVPNRLRVEHPDCEHDFPDAMRELAYQLCDSVLRH